MKITTPEWAGQRATETDYELDWPMGPNLGSAPATWRRGRLWLGDGSREGLPLSVWQAYQQALEAAVTQAEITDPPGRRSVIRGLVAGGIDQVERIWIAWPVGPAPDGPRLRWAELVCLPDAAGGDAQRRVLLRDGPAATLDAPVPYWRTYCDALAETLTALEALVAETEAHAHAGTD